mmetsp:Transcript_38580/g.118563  ORF Transcript_38580/g.118563 Transcript_38580/m.118563 type:complete len:243 (-) Transcript_38580:1305-2033(-)
MARWVSPVSEDAAYSWRSSASQSKICVSASSPSIEPKMKPRRLSTWRPPGASSTIFLETLPSLSPSCEAILISLARLCGVAPAPMLLCADCSPSGRLPPWPSHAARYGSGSASQLFSPPAISSSVSVQRSSSLATAAWSRSRPMQTSSLLRSPNSALQQSWSASSSAAKPSGHWLRGIATHHGRPGASVNWVPARAVCACCQLRVASHAKPLSRSSPASAPSSGRLPRAAWRRAGWKGRRAV